jgi:cell division protease FtsH
VAEAYEKAKSILTQYSDKLDAVAKRLLEVETISREEFEELFPLPVEKNGGTPVPQLT